MAKIAFRKLPDYTHFLDRFSAAFAQDEILNKAVYAGSKVVADQIRANLEALPEEKFRQLKNGEKFSGVPEAQKQDLIASFGLTPIERDNTGFVNTKAGFDGYGSHPSKKYPQGLPNQLLARSIESGSSVRDKHPFVRPAVQATRQKAVEEMEKVINENIDQIYRG